MRQAFGAWQPGRALQLSPPCLRPGPTLRPACVHSCCAAGCFRRRGTATAEDSSPAGVLRVTAAMPARIEERSSHGPTPLAARLEWAGFAPLQPPQTPEPVVAIARDEQHGDLMDFFWAAVARGELSQRVLDLTGEIILQLNSSNYSVWEWRWRCVGALGGPAAHAAEEKALMRVVAAENPKNYQLWNARRRLALALGPEVAEEVGWEGAWGYEGHVRRG